jgi:hypothetical protein
MKNWFIQGFNFCRTKVKVIWESGWLYGFIELMHPRDTLRLLYRAFKTHLYRTKMDLPCKAGQDLNGRNGCGGKITFLIRPAMMDDFGQVTKAKCNKCGQVYAWAWHVNISGGCGCEMPKATQIKRSDAPGKYDGMAL